MIIRYDQCGYGLSQLWLLSWQHLICVYPGGVPAVAGKLLFAFVEVFLDDGAAVVEWNTDVEVVREVLGRRQWLRVLY